MVKILSVLALMAVVATASEEATPRELNRPLNPANSFSFFFWGDWGFNIPAGPNSASGIPYEEALVAAQVTAYSKIFQPSFYVLLGDNFYLQGVNSTTDPIWHTYFEDVYTDPVTYVPWYPVFGNHDYYGKAHNPQPEIDYYLEGRDNRWVFPDYQYTKIWKIPGASKKTVQIFFINTVTMCPESEYGTNDDKIPWPVNPTKSYPNPNPTSSILDEIIARPTVQWLDRALNASTADWKIIAGHYHVWTNTAGDVSKPEALCLRDRMVPLMHKYGVDAYMHGHEHNFEHFVVDGLNYLTVGHGCSEADALLPGNPPGLMFNRTVGGFAHMRVYQNKLHFDFIDENANFIYSNDIYKSRRNLRAKK